MLSENRAERNQMEMFCIDSFVPEDHLLRKIDEALDFGRIYEIVGDLYCHNNGRPSVDPVVLFKIVFIQHLYGIPSLRRTCEEIKMNVAYRWFLGYLMNEQLPHFSTVSQNFKHRFTEETINQVFEWILSEVEKHGYLTPDAVFVDGTHIKANANLHKAVKKAIPKAAREYEKQLMEEINADREDTERSRLTIIMMIRTAVRSRLKKRPLPNPRPTRKAAYSIRANTRSALRMKRIQLVTNAVM